MAQTEFATLAGGCFWCVEAGLEQLAGVVGVQPGYMGGSDPAPTYEKVCSGRTGHAEVVRVEFDPAVLDYETLLTAFFAVHDPTTLNRQGHDVGTQYRSAIFYHDDAQRLIAEALVERLAGEGVFDAPIVTEVTPASAFHVAESYHHQYFRNNPYQGYCMAVAAPKAAKIRRLFAERLKPAFR